MSTTLYLLKTQEIAEMLTLPKRKTGTSEVSAIGFGGMGLSVGYGNP